MKSLLSFLPGGAAWRQAPALQLSLGRLSSVLCLLSSVTAWSLEGHAQQILLHDGFEAPSVAGHALTLTGPFSFGVWSGVAASHGGNAGVVVGPDNGLAPVEGVQHFAFNGGNPSDRTWVQTSLNTEVAEGTALRLEFALGRGGAGGQLLHARVQVWGSPSTGSGFSEQLLLEEIAIPEQANVYTWFSFDFTSAGSDSLRIRFEDVSGPNQVSDLWLDGVTLTQTISASAIPETVDWAEYAGFAVLGYRILKRRRLTAKNAENAKIGDSHKEHRDHKGWVGSLRSLRSLRLNRFGFKRSRGR